MRLHPTFAFVLVAPRNDFSVVMLDADDGIRQLKSVHSLTHPGAKLERPATAETKPSPTPTETVIELHAALDAEAAEETRQPSVEELGSTVSP